MRRDSLEQALHHKNRIDHPMTSTDKVEARRRESLMEESTRSLEVRELPEEIGMPEMQIIKKVYPTSSKRSRR